jgi:hypothetical protein
MRTTRLIRSALSFCAAAILPACGGSQPPIGAPGVMHPFNAITTHAEHGRSWMLPDAKSHDLLYVSDFYGVEVLSYPKGLPMGRLASGGGGLCADRAGNIFVPNLNARNVYEYAHGGTKPIRIFYDISVDFNPWDCSVDPTTGNLAVTSLDAPSVVIFPKAKNWPRVYYDPYAILFECAYDDKGNLYVDPVVHRHRLYIGVLLKSTHTFKNFLLDSRAGHPGGLQFDGRHVVADDLRTNTLHQLRFSGSKAIVVGSTPLNGATSVAQYWIQGKIVIGPDEFGPVYYWKYPAGGSPIYEIQAFFEPEGSTVSLAPTH